MQFLFQRSFRTILLLWLVCQTCTAHVNIETEASEIARAVGNAFLDNELTFINWEGGFQYGPAIVVDGLYEALEIVDQSTKSNWQKSLSKILSRYYQDDNNFTIPCKQVCPYGKCLLFRRCAFDILHTTMPLNDAIFRNVGDLMNLFPIGYLRRYSLNSKLYPLDLEMAKTAVEKYVLTFPLRTFDGTFARRGGFSVNQGTPEEQMDNAPFLWADDQYMGLTLIARYSTLKTLTISQEERLKLVDFITEMQLRFANHISDHENDGLIYHGTYLNETTKIFSCCKWGRANGWGAMSHIEVLKSLEQFPNIQIEKKYWSNLKRLLILCFNFKMKKVGVGIKSLMKRLHILRHPSLQ